MNKYLIGTALAAVAFATPAAAETPVGPRVEALVGVQIVREKIPGIVSPSVRLDDTGLVYGVGAGWDFAVSDGISVGIDAELTDSNAKNRKNFIGEIEYDDDLFADAHYRASVGLDAYVGGRLSFSISDISNAYLKAGYTRLKYKRSLHFTDFDTGENIDDIIFDEFGDDYDYDLDRHVGGWRIGAGAQTQLWGNSYVGGEVAYSNYKGDLNTLRAALMVGYRFGARPAPEPVYVAPAPLPPAPEPAPATQTCADGSVILATDMCPPPPAPAPVPERG